MSRILTNKTNLPLPIYAAIKNDSYVPHGDISVTTLIDSPYLRLLRKYNEYEEDASEMIWAVMGQALHSVIEKAGKKLDGSFFYPEFKMELKVGDTILSGTSDLIEKREYPMMSNEDLVVGVGSELSIHDYKNIFVWSAKLGKESPNYKHWLLQTNIYAVMAKYGKYVRMVDGKGVASEKKIGLNIDKIFIHGFIRDWKKSEMKRMDNYPKAATITLEVEVLPEEQVIAYIRERIKLHFEAEKKYLAGEEISHCTEEERWTRPETWRVMKIGGKRALSGGVFTIKSEDDKKQVAEFYAANAEKYKGLLKIEKTEGEDIRCSDYCSVCQFCSYYKSKYNEYGERRKATDDSGENSTVPESTEGTELQGLDIF